MILVYRSDVGIGDLELDQCTIRGVRDEVGRAWWQLWIWVRREDSGDLLYVAAPVNPNGPYLVIDGRKMWGLTRLRESDWQVSPSIDVVGKERADGTREPSLWHQTPRIVGVPAGERWIAEAP